MLLHKTEVNSNSVHIIYVCYYLLCSVRGLNAYLKTQQYINLATSGIANIMVFRQGLLPTVSIQKRVHLGLIL